MPIRYTYTLEKFNMIHLVINLYLDNKKKTKIFWMFCKFNQITIPHSFLLHQVVVFDSVFLFWQVIVLISIDQARDIEFKYPLQLFKRNDFLSQLLAIYIYSCSVVLKTWILQIGIVSLHFTVSQNLEFLILHIVHLIECRFSKYVYESILSH